MGQRSLETGDRRPFGIPWLDSCYGETLLPEAKWHTVQEALCDGLAQKIEKHVSQDKRRQMVFELVGEEFVSRYFKDKPNDPAILEPPATSVEDRRKLQIDAQNWLQNALNHVASEVSCQRPEVVREGDEDVSTEMEDFLLQTRSVILKGMERHLYLQEEVLIKKKKLKMEALEKMKEDHTMWAKWQAAEQRKRQTAHIRGILKNPHPQPPSSASSGNSLDHKPPSTARVREELYTPEDQPPLWGYQSESLGRSLIAILKQDPRRFSEVAWRLHGRQLPGSLRMYIWLDVLLLANRASPQGADVNVEKIARERFGMAVSRGMEEMKLSRATHSPISSLIDKAVIEIYDTTPSMKFYINDNVHMKEATKALNVLYCFDRSYEPYLVSWLFPLQLAFKEQSGDHEHVYEMGLYLHLLANGCFPKWPEVFSLAERVIETLRIADEELLLHLQTIAKVQPNIDPKGFLVQLITEEKTKAETLRHAAAGSRTARDIGAKLLTDPLIYIRRWIGEGFVRVLDTPAVVWLWDQLFMEKWDRKTLVDASLALLLLLRHRFMEATDHSSMAQVFLMEPCKLYTKDVQRAWMHLQYGGQPGELPAFNRRGPNLAQIWSLQDRAKCAPLPGRYVLYLGTWNDMNSNPKPQTTVLPLSEPGLPESPEPESRPPPSLDPVGIKSVVVEITFTSAVIDRESWVKRFQPDDVKLLCSVYFGTTQLSTQVSSKPASCPRGARLAQNGDTTYKIYFLKNLLAFEKLDPFQLDIEEDMGAHPYAIIQADYYGHEDAKAGRGLPITLGWARLQLFKHQSEASKTWLMLKKRDTYKMTPGAVPENLTVRPADVAPPTDPVYISPYSELQATIFDLRDDKPPSPVPSPLTAARELPPPAAADAPTVNDTFDFYVDGVDSIPDNATIIKLTGRILKTGELSGIPDIQELPEMKSPARSPTFKFRMTINKESLVADPDMIVLLRVYTVDRDSKEPKDLCVIGSCLYGFFNSNGILKTGCHRRLLRSGMPDLSRGMGELHPEGLHSTQRVPGASVYFRILPYSKDGKPPPKNKSAYQFDNEDLLASDREVVASYASNPVGPETWPQTEADMVKYLQEMEGKATSSEAPRVWLRERLNQQKHLPPKKPANNLPRPYMVHYRMPAGINVQITKAYGLPGGRYVQCFTRVLLGQDVEHKQPTQDGLGRRDMFLTGTHDFDGRQRAPVWIDQPKRIHPHPDLHNCLLVQLIGLQVVYQPTEDHNQPGKVTTTAGTKVTLTADSVLGWAVVPLMRRWSVWSGEFHLPVLKQKPDEDLVRDLSRQTVEEVFQTRQWSPDNLLMGASVVVKVWDGHFTPEELPQEFKPVETFLDIVGDKEKYVLARTEKTGKKLYQMVLASLGKKYQKLGTNSFIFEREKGYFSRVMDSTVTSMMVAALEASGYGPLTT